MGSTLILPDMRESEADMGEKRKEMSQDKQRKSERVV